MMEERVVKFTVHIETEEIGPTQYELEALYWDDNLVAIDTEGLDWMHESERFNIGIKMMCNEFIKKRNENTIKPSES